MLNEYPKIESHRSTQLTPAEKTCLELIKAEIEEIKGGKTEEQLRKQGRTDVLHKLLAKLEEKARFSKDEKQRKKSIDRLLEENGDKLVKFRDEQIPLCEYWALEKMVEDINNDYKEQRRETGELEPKDIKLEDVQIEVKDESVISINLASQKPRKAPSVVRTLTNLQELNFSYNPKLEDISALSGLTNLQALVLSNNPKLEDIKELSGLTNLQILYLHNNLKLKDISALEHLDNLIFVNLRNTGIDKEYPNTERIIDKLRSRGCNVLTD